MARIFYTERDIEDMAKRGVTEIEIDDSVYITDLARETMDKLGVKRKVTGSQTAYSSVLASPDVAKLHTQTAPAAPAAPASPMTLSPAEKQEVADRVKSGVIARLGPGVDTVVVEKIVQRVVNAL